MKPNEILALKKEKAKYKKQSEIFKAQLASSIKKSNILSKEALDSAYDPEDPASTQKAIEAHTAKVQKMIDEAYADVDADTEKYLQAEYSDDKIEMTSQLAAYNEANNTKLTYENLTDDLPPKFMKKFKAGDYDDTEALFKEANDYLLKTGGVYDPTPPKAPDGNHHPAPADDGIEGDEGEQY